MMTQPRTSIRQRVPQQPVPTPLSILRTETVLSRFPIHTLAKRGRIAIGIRRTNAQGALDLRWEVSYNERYGPPRQLAYKLDTIVINQILDAIPRPLPRVIPIGSMTHVCGMLDLADSGRQHAELKRTFHQNASAYIVAYLRYRGRDGTERILNTGFTRYGVIFTGERLPDGTQADAVYLVLSEPYLEILTHAPVRPLDYAYLKALTPMAQRFYEILSYKMFAALKHRQPQATLRYADYCLLSTQQRYTDVMPMQKQMYKVHQPHVQSGYLTKVVYAATTDDTGQPDWLLHYTPGPKARAEYAAFMRQPGVETARPRPEDPEPADLLALMMPETPASPASTAASAAPPHPQAVALVQQFYQHFHGRTGVTPMAKELTQATALLTTHGWEKAQYLLTFSHQAAQATRFDPQVFGGILHYTDRALAAYDARAAQGTHATTRQAAAAERTQREQHRTWEQQQLAGLRAALLPAALAALEEASRARLVAAGTPAYALRMGVRAAVDQVLAAQAGLPSFADWRQTQEAGG
jgi:hypothetical protein